MKEPGHTQTVTEVDATGLDTVTSKSEKLGCGELSRMFRFSKAIKNRTNAVVAIECRKPFS
jgi:hypothetical protein